MLKLRPNSPVVCQIFNRLTARPALLPAVAAAMLGVAALAPAKDAAAKDAPATEPIDTSPAAAANSPDGTYWNLTPYLKGTTPQIRDKINGETERLMQLVAETLKDVHDTSASIEARLKSDSANVKKSAPYLKAQADLKAAQQEHDTTTGAARMEAGARANKLKAAIDSMEPDAISNDKELNDERAHLREIKAALKRHQAALEKATAWRSELVKAIRGGAELHWPLNAASSGLLGIVTPREITSEGVMIDFQAMEKIGEGKDEEGVLKFSAVPHRVHLLVTGIDTAGMKEDVPVVIDRHFAVDHISRDDARLGSVYVLKPAPAPIDELLAAVVPLRGASDK